jgi:hypothetical protein
MRNILKTVQFMSHNPLLPWFPRPLFSKYCGGPEHSAVHPEWYSADPTFQIGPDPGPTLLTRRTIQWTNYNCRNSYKTLKYFSDFLGKYVCTLSKTNRTDFTDFPVKKIRSGCGTIIPDPDAQHCQNTKKTKKLFWLEIRSRLHLRGRRDRLG